MARDSDADNGDAGNGDTGHDIGRTNKSHFQRRTCKSDRIVLDRLRRRTERVTRLRLSNWIGTSKPTWASIASRRLKLFGELREFFDLESLTSFSLDSFKSLRDIVNLLITLPGKGDWLARSTQETKLNNIAPSTTPGASPTSSSSLLPHPAPINAIATFIDRTRRKLESPSRLFQIKLLQFNLFHLKQLQFKRPRLKLLQHKRFQHKLLQLKLHRLNRI